MKTKIIFNNKLSKTLYNFITIFKIASILFQTNNRL